MISIYLTTDFMHRPLGEISLPTVPRIGESVVLLHGTSKPPVHYTIKDVGYVAENHGGAFTIQLLVSRR